MRKILIILLFLLQFADTARSQKYLIRGIIKDLPIGSSVSLIRPVKSGFVTVASTTAMNGRFEFTGRLALEGEGYFLALDTALSKKAIPIFMVHSSIMIYGDVKLWPTGVVVDGSQPTDDYHKFLNLLKPHKTTLQNYEQELITLKLLLNETRTGKSKEVDTVLLKRQILSLEEKEIEEKNTYYKIWDEFIIQNPNSLYTPHAIIKYENSIKLKGMEIAYLKLTPRVRNSFYGAELKNRIEQLKKIANIKLDNNAPEFVSITPEGTRLSLKEVVSKGKLTLVDFWASWCKPCRKEIPNIKKVYQAFRNRGFNVLGVSLDNNRRDWLDALEEEQMPWLQVSQLKGREEEASQLYQIKGIPSYLLLDENGKILAIDFPGSVIPSAGGRLHGDDLYKKIEEILGK